MNINYKNIGKVTLMTILLAREYEVLTTEALEDIDIALANSQFRIEMEEKLAIKLGTGVLDERKFVLIDLLVTEVAKHISSYSNYSDTDNYDQWVDLNLTRNLTDKTEW